MEPILELHHLTKTYPGFTLRDVSFTLPRGYIMGLIGPNGAGKTTIVRAILNLLRPDSGDIRVFGLDHRRDEVAVRSRIGFVHENPRFHETLPVARAAAVVARFYPTWDDAAFRRLAAEFSLPLDKPVRALSHGMRTRLALAMALAHRAELLVLDEPSSGLDPLFRRELLDRLSGLIEGGDTSVLFSTHITSDLDRIADFVTFLQKGRLVFSSTKEEVLSRWAVVKGGPDLLTDDARALFLGITTGEVGFTALTSDVDRARRHFAGATVLIEPATLDDVVYYTGRSANDELRLYDDRG